MMMAAAAADVALYCGDDLSSREQRQACVSRLAKLDVPLSTLVAVMVHRSVICRYEVWTFTTGCRRVRSWALACCPKAPSPATGHCTS